MSAAICVSSEELAINIKNLLDTEGKKKNVRLESCIFASPELLTESDKSISVVFIETVWKNFDGTELTAKLKEKNPKVISVFFADSNKMLDKAMDLGAVRYILKPASDKQLTAAVDAVFDKILQTACAVYIKGKKAVTRVFKDDIVYVEIEKRKTKIVTKDKTYYSNHPMSFWRKSLQGANFLSPHNSYIVNLDYMKKYSRNKSVIMCNGNEISVSRTKLNSFSNGVNEYLTANQPFKA